MEQSEFTTINMTNEYPFASIPNQTSASLPPIVRRVLPHSHPSLPKNAVELMRTLHHPHLLSLIHSQEGPQSTELFYEYVPFRLERWITNVDENILQSLQDQLLSVADYLIKKGIQFDFCPNQVGLDENMDIKLYLGQFSVNLKNYDHNYHRISNTIQLYFKKLKTQWNCPMDPFRTSCIMEQDQENNNNSNRSMVRRKIRKLTSESTSTHASTSFNEDSSCELNSSLTLIQEGRDGLKKARLSEQAAKSMKRSMEVLVKFKMNSFSK